MSHFIDLRILGGELHLVLRCDSPENAPCRSRPADWEHRESWTREESTLDGFPCWTEEWVDAVGISEAITGADTLLASVAVDILYQDGIEISPVLHPTDTEPEMSHETRYPDVRVELSSADSNAFVLIGAATRALRENGVSSDEIDRFRSEATSGDYDHLIATISRWMEVV